MPSLRPLSVSLVLASIVGGLWLVDDARGGDRHNPQCREYQYGTPDLFYNYYVPPTCGGLGAQLYVAPLPVPPHVGHTYYTYQPLMPHEFLYKHHRTYHRYYDDGRGLTRTSVRWW